jgi:hypothetical protein
MNPLVVLALIGALGFVAYKFMKQETETKIVEREPEGGVEVALTKIDHVVGEIGYAIEKTLDFIETDIPEFFGGEGYSTLKADASFYNGIFQGRTAYESSDAKAMIRKILNSHADIPVLVGNTRNGQWGLGYQIRHAFTEMFREASILGIPDKNLFVPKYPPEANLIPIHLMPYRLGKKTTTATWNRLYGGAKTRLNIKYKNAPVTFGIDKVSYNYRIPLIRSGNEEFTHLKYAYEYPIVNASGTKPNRVLYFHSLIPGFTYIYAIWVGINSKGEIDGLTIPRVKECIPAAKRLIAKICMYAPLENAYLGFYVKHAAYKKLWCKNKDV